MARASVEIGLLALALTAGHPDRRHRPVGRARCSASPPCCWARPTATLGLPIAAAALGGRRRRASPGGALNALLVARLGMPPLIVTLGTYSLFRGLAEGFTGGVRNYTDFPPALPVPRPGPPARRRAGAAPAAGGGGRRSSGCSSTARRSDAALRAIGFSPEGARYAGIPVARAPPARLRAQRG